MIRIHNIYLCYKYIDNNLIFVHTHLLISYAKSDKREGSFYDMKNLHIQSENITNLMDQD